MDQYAESARILENLAKWIPFPGLRFDLNFAAKLLRGQAVVSDQLDRSIMQTRDAIDRWVYWKRKAIELGHSGDEPDGEPK